MRRIFWLYLALLPLVVVGQDAPMKNANTILVSTTLADSALYRMVGTYLLSSGYVIDRSDNTLKSVSTAKRKIDGVNCMYVLYASVEGGKVRLSGGFLIPEMDSELTQIENRGSPRSPFKSAFNAINRAAVDLKNKAGGQIEYVRQ